MLIWIDLIFQSLPTSCHLETQELKKKMDTILDEAANCFTSCKDSSGFLISCFTRVCVEQRICTTLILFYKDSEPQILPNIKDNLRTTQGLFLAKSFFEYAKTKNIPIMTFFNSRSRSSVGSTELFCQREATNQGLSDRSILPPVILVWSSSHG